MKNLNTHEITGVSGGTYRVFPVDNKYIYTSYLSQNCANAIDQRMNTYNLAAKDMQKSDLLAVLRECTDRDIAIIALQLM